MNAGLIFRNIEVDSRYFFRVFPCSKCPVWAIALEEREELKAAETGH
jgi:hypothetical protein